jgi:hypothetical protein
MKKKGRPRIDQFWIDQIRTLTQDKPEMTAPAICREFELALTKATLTPPRHAEKIPDQRTVRRIMKHFRELPETEQRTYASFQWPQSMESKDLPWEASAAALELLRHEVIERPSALPVADKGFFRAPTNHTALWFWRITLAAPDAPIEFRARLARDFQVEERYVEDRRRLGLPMDKESANHLREQVRWEIAYRIWDPKNKEAYERAQESGLIPRSRRASARPTGISKSRKSAGGNNGRQRSKKR